MTNRTRNANLAVPRWRYPSCPFQSPNFLPSNRYSPSPFFCFESRNPHFSHFVTSSIRSFLPKLTHSKCSSFARRFFFPQIDTTIISDEKHSILLACRSKYLKLVI